MTDFEDELEGVDGPVFKRVDASLSVRLDPAQAVALRRLAEAGGLNEESLLRKWITEKLDAA